VLQTSYAIDYNFMLVLLCDLNNDHCYLYCIACFADLPVFLTLKCGLLRIEVDPTVDQLWLRNQGVKFYCINVLFQLDYNLRAVCFSFVTYVELL
jgi:hypothetical protein